MVFFGHHGDRDEESRLGQRFVVDVEVEADLERAGRSDRLEETLDYGAIYRVVQEVLEGRRHRLLESLASTVGERVLAQFPADRVMVRIKKPSVPIAGHLEYAGVEMVFSRRTN